MLGFSKAGMMGGAPYLAPGTTFTGYAHGMASSPRRITYGFDKWWVVCSAGQLYSSASGRSGSWTLITTFSSFSPQNINFANGRLIVVGPDQVKWSTDGSTFSSFAFTHIGSYGRFSSHYGGGYFLCCFGANAGAKYLWTGDFTTWTVTTNSSGNSIAGFIWDGAKFLVASDGANAMRYFTDPSPTTAWSTQGVAPPVNHFESFVASGSRLLGAGYINGSYQAHRAWTDDAGTTWTHAFTAGPSSTDKWTFAYSGGGMVLLGMNPGGADGWLYKSTDGGATVSLLFSATSETMQDAAYGDGRFTVISSTKIYIDR